jgi:hypothetical protein
MNDTEIELLTRCSTRSGGPPDTFAWHKDIGADLLERELIHRKAGWYFITREGTRVLDAARRKRKAFDMSPHEVRNRRAPRAKRTCNPPTA